MLACELQRVRYFGILDQGVAVFVVLLRRKNATSDLHRFGERVTQPGS